MKDNAVMPKMTFSTFIVSLNASAMVHLGMIADPVNGKKIKNLSLGKQTIDILSMLKEKTEGNLTSDEKHILKEVLYDLKIHYVKQQRG